MERKARKFFSVLLCFCMVMTSLFIPLNVQAEDANTSPSIFTMGPNPYYSVGQAVGVQVKDASTTQSSITVKVNSSTDTTGVAITLTQDSNAQGSFTGKVLLSTGPSDAVASTPTIQCANSDKVTFCYEAANSTSGSAINTYITVADRVEAPQASLDTAATTDTAVTADPAFVTTNTAVTLATGTTGASIFYTIDGSTPTRGSIAYTESAKPVIQANRYTILKAFAIKDNMADSAVSTFEYNKPVSISGHVQDPNGANITGSGIELHKKIDGYYRYQTYYPSMDGNFTISGLNPGEYRIRGNVPFESDYSFTDFFDFKVTEEGAFLDLSGAPVSNIALTANPVQLRGTATGTTGSALKGNEYDVRIRPANPNGGNNINFDPNKYDQCYKVSKLSDGDYFIWIEPRDELQDPSATASFAQYFTVTGGVASPSSISLQLTNPQLMGTVKLQDNSTAVTSGWVDIMTSGESYLQGVQIKPDGSFKIGGLFDGTYKIRANPPPELTGYQSSDEMTIIVSGGKVVSPEGPVTLLLRQKLLRVQWVGSLGKGNDQFGVRMENMDLAGDYNYKKVNLTAVVSGTGISCTYDHDEDWDNNASATVFFRIPDNQIANLQYGSYPLAVYNGTGLVEGSGANLAVIKYIDPVKRVYSQEEYSTSGAILVFYNSQNDYPWNANESLTAKIWTDSQNETLECTASANTDANRQLTVNVPVQKDAPSGWRKIRIFRGEQLLAEGRFQVGTTRIDGADTINQGDNRVRLYGDCLAAYETTSITAEVWRDGSRLASSTNNRLNEQSNLEFEFPVGFDVPGDNYQVKVIEKAADGFKTLGEFPFKVAPLLVSDPHSTNGNAVTIYNSSINAFRWNTTDINNFIVNVHDANGNEYNWDIGPSGLSLVNGNLVVNPLAGGHAFPSNATTGRMEVNVSGQHLGYAEFTIGDAVLYGRVTAPGTDTVVPGGKIFIQNLDQWDNSGKSVNIGANGQFFISANEIPRQSWKNSIDGKYALTAVPTEGAIFAASKPVTIEIVNGLLSGTNNIALQLQNTQLSGVVKNYDGAAANQGNIDIFDDSNERNWVTNANVFANGTFRVGGLSEGTYWIKASPGNTWWQVSSDMQRVTTGAMNIAISLKAPQVFGTVKDADGKDLAGGQYDIKTRSLDGKDGKCEWYPNEGYYVAGNLAPGRYGIRVAPKDDTTYTQSMEAEFTVEEGVTTTQTIHLQLTRSQFGGRVFAPDGTTPITSGSITILDSAGNYLTDVNIRQDGTYKVGGLVNGDYYLAANPDKNNPAYNDYDTSTKAAVTIDGVTTPAGVNFVLRNKAPLLKYVGNLVKGDGSVTARIRNSSKIGNENGWANVRAEITNGTGVLVNISQFEVKDQDDNSDECTLAFNSFDDSSLFYGNYTLKVYYKNQPLSVEGSNVFSVVAGAETVPFIINKDASAYNGRAMLLKVGSGYYPWSAGDHLTVRITAEQNQSIQTTTTAAINNDNTLSFKLPALASASITEGGQLVEVLRDYGTNEEQQLAVCKFTVGNGLIKGLCAKEGSTNLVVAGQYMQHYMDNPYLEIYKGGALVSRSQGWFPFRGNISLNLTESLISGVQYTARFYCDVNGTRTEIGLPNGGVFKAVPRLISENPLAPGKASVISGQTPGESITINESSNPDYQWTSGEAVQAWISVPGKDGYTATVSNGLVVSESEVVFTALENSSTGFPLPKGPYTIDLYGADGRDLGYAEFSVGEPSQVLVGTVKCSDGNASTGGSIRFSKKGDDNWGDLITVEQNGRFYFPLYRFNCGDGEYTLTAVAPNGSQDSNGYLTVNVSGGVVYLNGAQTNNVEIDLNKTQIKGRVTAGSSPAAFARASLDLNSSEKLHYDVSADAEGNYKFGGLKPGSYTLRAYADSGDYLSSDPEELTIGSTTEGSSAIVRDLQLKLPQLTGSVLTWNGNPLNGDQYKVRIRNLNNPYDNDVNYDWRPNDGMYMVRGLEAGRYTISIEPNDPSLSKSFEEEFTVDEAGNALPSVIDLKLSRAELTGTVYKAQGSALTFAESYVDVYKGSWVDPEYVTTVGVDKDGKFTLGGLESGDYWIRAGLNNRWDSANASMSISRIMKVTISETATIPVNVGIYMADSKPRIRWIRDYSRDEGKLRVRLINAEGIDLSKLTAEIVSATGASTIITGQQNFWVDYGNWDNFKNEADLVIQNVDLLPGEYTLNLKYDGADVENETPADESTGFLSCYNLYADPYALKPESTGGATLRLSLGVDSSKYPWAAGDTLQVRMVNVSGSDDTVRDLSYSYNSDKTLKVTLPAENLAQGDYLIGVVNNSGLIAKGWLTVGYAQIKEIYNIDDESDTVTLDGSDMITYLDQPSKVEIRDAGNKLVLSSTEAKLDDQGRLYYYLGQTLAPGTYTLSMTYNGSQIKLPSEGRFKVFTKLIADPSYMIIGSTSGAAMVLKLKDGAAAPWAVTDSLLVEVYHYEGNGSFTTVPMSVSTTAVAIRMPNVLNEGQCGINLYKVDASGVREQIACASFDLTAQTQVHGFVIDTQAPMANRIPYSTITVLSGDGKNWIANFAADQNGNYAIYGLKPGTYLAYAKPPRGMALLESNSVTIVVTDTGAVTVNGNNQQGWAFELQAARRISGQVLLPNSETIPGSAINTWVAAWSDMGTPDNKDDDRWISTDVRIPAGASSADYSILVPVDDTSYRLILWSDGIGYVDGSVYYGTSGSAIRISDAAVIQVNGGDQSGKDISFVEGTQISGTISLPDGMTADERGVDVTVSVVQDHHTGNSYDNIIRKFIETIPSGKNSTQYRIVVPSAADYTISYNLDTDMKLGETGYYKSSTESAVRASDATVIDASGTEPMGINLKLMGGRTISGTITLPAGVTIPTSGASVWIGACSDKGTEDKSDDYWAGTEVQLTAGQSSARYTIVVPDNKDTYWVQLSGGTQLGCSDPIYYSSTGAAYNVASAAKLTMDSDKDGINLNVVKGRKITGTVTLPQAAPAGGRNIKVEAIADYGNNDSADDIYAGTKVFIAEGTTQADFTLIVPDAAGYRVQYNADPAYGLVEYGYYTPVGTTVDFSKAAHLDMTKGDQGGINLSVFNARVISGTVTIPQAVTTDIELRLDIGDEKVLEDQSDDFWTGYMVEIPAGKTSVPFTIAVPEASATGGTGKYVIQVSNGSVAGCVDTMFYSSTGSAFRISDAEKIDVNGGNQGNINLVLVKGHKISGTVKLPTGAAITAGSIEMMVAATVKSSTGNPRENIWIQTKTELRKDAAASQYTGTYSIYVPAMSDLRVGYFIDTDTGLTNQFEARGFYKNAAESTVDYYTAEQVNTTASDAAGIDLNVLNATTPACISASVTATGTAITLDFNKPLINVTAAGFTVTVAGDPYEIAGISQSSSKMSLTLQLKNYYIYKDYSNIQVTYSDVSGGISAYDGRKLPSFTSAVTNSSSRVFSLGGIADKALVNRDVTLKATSTEDAVTISDGTPSTPNNGINTKVFTTDGTYNVTVSASHRKAVTTLSFTIDKTAPGVTISNVPDTTENSHDGVKPVVAFSDDVASMRTLTLNGQAYDGSAVKEAGHYVLTASTKDAAGNITTRVKAFDIVWDTTGPAISVNIANGAILESDPALTINLTGGSNAANYTYTAKLKKPDGSIAEFTKSNIPAITAEGAYRLEIQAVNPGYTDITSTKVVEFTLDKNAPVVSIDNITNNKHYNTSVTPVISFTDAVASQQLLTSNAAITLTKNSSTAAFKLGDTITDDGSYVLTVSTTDGKGHASNTTSAAFVIDRTKPAITITGALDGYTYKDQNVTVSAISLDGSLVVECNGKPLTMTGNQAAFTGTPGGIQVYKLVFTSTDAAGNVTEYPLSFTIDRLPVNIQISGISEGQIVNSSPDIGFAVYEGQTAVEGATATIDGKAFTGGLYGTEGSHTLTVSYVKGANTYTKTVHFTVDKTKPAISITGVLKNGASAGATMYVKAGDTIKVTADVSDAYGVGEVTFNVGTVVLKVPMKFVSGTSFEGEYKVEGGNSADQVISLNVSDTAGNTNTVNGSKVTIINTKPTVSLATTPAGPDGTNGIYRSSSMSLTLGASASDTIYYYFNGSSATSTGAVTLKPAQGTNTLVYYAVDLAGNKSDQKAFVFEYDSVKPANVTVSPVPKALDNKSLISIAGSVPGEGGKTGSRVLLKKLSETAGAAAEIVAQAAITSAGAFTLDGIKLTEGINRFELIARDAAGNESATAATITTRLDSIAPIVKVEKAQGDDVTYTVDVLDSAVSSSAISAKFNGAELAADKIVNNGAITGGQRYTITVPGQIDGTNTLNVLAADTAGNTGSGSYTSTYIAPSTAQSNLPLNDNATMDIPDDAFGGTSSVQMLVKTVDVKGAEAYKPLGAPIAFEFEQNGVSVEPANELVIRNFIGTGLTGVVLMHITSSGAIDAPITAEQTTSDTFSEAGMGTFETGHAYYLSDTGYLVFKTKSFSSYQVVQDNTAPVITVTTTDFDINKADADSGKKSIAGTLDDSKAGVTEVTVDGSKITLNGTTGSAFSIQLPLTDGTHEVILKASDTVGNVSSVTRTYRVDATPPVLSASASATQTNNDTANININVSENSEISMNGSSKGTFNGSNVIPFTLGQGANSIAVMATDAFGNATTASAINIELDSIKPEITITGISDGDVYGSAVNIAVHATDAHLAGTTIKMDGAAYTPGSYSAEGMHTLTVTAADTFGNSISRSVAFTIDTSVPTIMVTGAANNGAFNADKTLSIAASNADELKVTRSIDGQAPQSVTASGLTASVNLTADANTQHTYVVKAVASKTVGGQVRTASSTYTVTIDKKKPVIVSTTATETTADKINITGSLDETADLYLDSVLKVANAPAGTFTFADSALAIGSKDFAVKAVDKAGNETTITITVKRNTVTPSNGGNTNPGGGASGGTGITAPAVTPVVTAPTTPATSSAIVLSPLERKNSGELKPVTEPIPGNAVDSAENKAIGANGGSVSTSDGAFGLKIPAGAVSGNSNIFRLVVFEVQSGSPLATEEQVKSGKIKIVSDVVDFGTTADKLIKPVTATFHYDRQAVTNAQNLRVFYWNARTNAWVPVAAANIRVNAKDGLVEADLQHFTRYAVMEVKNTLKFADVKNQWHATYVDRITAMGITTGIDSKGVKVFKPDAKISRVEFVAMLARTLKLSAPSQSLSAFKDASGIPSWAVGYIKAAYAKGIISPYKDGTFKAKQSITREEMAVMLIKAMGLKPSSNASSFKDQKNISAAARGYVTKAAEKNILSGKADGLFHPADSLTRAEAAKVIVEMIEVLGTM